MPSPTEKVLETRTIGGVDFQIVSLLWPDGVVQYDVYWVLPQSDELLTEAESLDHIPTDEEINTLFQEWN